MRGGEGILRIQLFSNQRGRSPQGLVSDKTVGNVRALVESADGKGMTMRELENQVKNICRGSIASKIGPEGD